jgi:hypothetical protein
MPSTPWKHIHEHINLGMKQVNIIMNITNHHRFPFICLPQRSEPHSIDEPHQPRLLFTRATAVSSALLTPETGSCFGTSGIVSEVASMYVNN